MLLEDILCLEVSFFQTQYYSCTALTNTCCYLDKLTCSSYSLFLSLLEPQLHLACTALGFYVGYLAHRYEENSEERVRQLLEKHRNAPVQWTTLASRNINGKYILTYSNCLVFICCSHFMFKSFLFFLIDE